MSGGIQIPVSADFNSQDTEREVQRLTAQLNKLGLAMGQLNKQKFNPVDRGTLDDMRRIEAQFQSLLKINGTLRSRLKATGQENVPFADVNWNRAYSDSNQRARTLRGIYDYSTAGTTFADRFMAPSQPGGGGGGRRPPTPMEEPGMDPASFPGHRIVDAGLRGAGPVGNVVASSLSSGLRGGLLAGAGAMIGGLGVLGAFKGVSAVMDKVGSAETESVGYDTLKRTLGDVNVQFDVLRSTLRQAAYSLQTTFDETQKLGTEFAKIANLGSGGARGLAGEVGVGGGLSRAFGLSLGAGVGVLGTGRQFGVTSDLDGSRRLALMIGEAVGRVGFAKADEVLAAVQQFTSMQARASMSAPNISGYLGALSGLAGSGRPGLDASGSAALLGRVNATIMAGGGAGEAGLNFMLANVGRPLGLNPIQTKIRLQQGAFGNSMGGLYGDFSAKFGGGRGPSGEGGTNLEMIMSGLKRSYGAMGPDFLAAAASQLLGVSETQAMALMTHGPATMGGIAGRLRAGGIPMSSLSSTAFGALAAIQSGDGNELAAQAGSLRGRRGAGALSQSERARLDAAMGGSDIEAQKQVLTELTATREQEVTEGTQVRASIAGVENQIQEFATKLIPISITARDALIALATALAPESEFGRNMKTGKTVSALSAFDDETSQLRNSQKYLDMSPDERQRWEAGRSGMRMPYAGAFQRTLGSNGDSVDALISAVMMTESGGSRFNRDGTPKSNSLSSALGEMQVLDSTAADPGFGIRPARPGDLDDRARVGRDLLGTYMGIFKGDVAKSAAAYKQGFSPIEGAIAARGDDWLRGTEQATQDYVAKVMKSMQYGGGGGGKYNSGQDEVHATLVLHPVIDGKPAGQPVRVRLGRPEASGSRLAE